MIYLQVFWEFFKIGLFVVGGGMAAVPFLYDLAAKTGWYTDAQLVDMIAISESTPGPIGLNMATYVGYTTAGLLGSLCASLAMILPGIIIVLIVVSILDKFRGNKYVDLAFYSLRPTSAGLIASAGITVALSSIFSLSAFKASGAIADFFNLKAISLALVVLVFSNWVRPTKKLHPIVFIIASAIIGVVFDF